MAGLTLSMLITTNTQTGYRSRLRHTRCLVSRTAHSHKRADAQINKPATESVIQHDHLTILSQHVHITILFYFF